MDDYQRILAEDFAIVNEAMRQIENTSFGFDPNLQKELESMMSKAFSKQDDILRKLTEEIRGLEDETDQAMTDEQVSCEFAFRVCKPGTFWDNI